MAVKSNVKIRVLESWYIIDSLLFSDHARNVIKEGSMFREYVSLKGAILSNLYEYYSHIDFNPVYGKAAPTSVRALTESAKINASKARKLSSNILKKEGIKEALKNRIAKESKVRKIKNIGKFTDKIITEKFIQIALDNALIGLPLLEAKNMKKCNDFKGQILEDAYKMMRNSIIEIARKCMKA